MTAFNHTFIHLQVYDGCIISAPHLLCTPQYNTSYLKAVATKGTFSCGSLERQRNLHNYRRTACALNCEQSDEADPTMTPFLK